MSIISVCLFSSSVTNLPIFLNYSVSQTLTLNWLWWSSHKTKFSMTPSVLHSRNYHTCPSLVNHCAHLTTVDWEQNFSVYSLCFTTDSSYFGCTFSSLRTVHSLSVLNSYSPSLFFVHTLLIANIFLEYKILKQENEAKSMSSSWLVKRGMWCYMWLPGYPLFL